MFPTDTDFETKITLEQESSPEVDDDLPFKILFMGNWSGTKSASNSDAFKPRPIEIDRDNFDEVMRKYDVELNLVFEEGVDNILSLKFNALKDFHPDDIFQRVAIFSNLRETRAKLCNHLTYNEAANEVRSWMGKEQSQNFQENPQQTRTPSDSQPAPDDLLDQILSRTVEQTPKLQNLNETSSELSVFVSKLVKPHLITTDLDERANLLLIVDEIISDLMRKILHHPQFQALESAWRGAYLLTRKIETKDNLKIFLVDASKSELSQDLSSVADLSDSLTFDLLSNPDYSWAIVCGNYTFGLNVEDVATLIRLAKIAVNSNVPCISHIQPQMFGFNSLAAMSTSDKLKTSENSPEAKLWGALRSLPEATHIGLALPRFLIRLPYGAATDPTETFYFEEFTPATLHEQYLWANPSFICAILLAQSFCKSGWDFTAGLIQNFDDLPLHVFQKDGVNTSKSCSEIALIQSNVETLIEQGLIPLISFRDTDYIRIGRFQSITFTGSMLSGRWNYSS